MSAIASFYHLPTDKIIGLREVWPNSFEYTREHGTEHFDDYNWSGYCIVAVLEYLKVKKDIDLSESRYNLLFPDAYDNGTWFLDKQLKDEYLEKVNAKLFSSKELKSAADSWFRNGLTPIEPLRAGLKLIEKSLKMVDDHSIMLVQVG
ncbi:MAG TPA: hypothetical protein V6C81_14055 [Planktothrix sp.]|jgi:hypothetical protein